jgi:diaminohydroxyphosphoribosylaminopyrimidine deaminase/5-amino-6-(5-phosphoribosylamino)uracil reductase
LEAGPTLNGAMIAAGLIDEVVVYMAPKVIGDDARGMFTLPGIERLEQAIELDLRDVRSVGGDLRLTLGVARQGE